ncbi:MAG: hypothetical protein SPG61_03290 [Arcanobacterium sp.]|nr:hypothetical protein [Arcanobacterium sp.]
MSGYILSIPVKAQSSELNTFPAPTFNSEQQELVIPESNTANYYVTQVAADGTKTTWPDQTKKTVIPAGSYTSSKDSLPNSGSLIVHAEPLDSTQEISGAEEWQFNYPETIASVSAPEPTINTAGRLLKIPALHGLRYYIYEGDPDSPEARLITYPGTDPSFSKTAYYGFTEGLPLGVPLTVVVKSVMHDKSLSGATKWKFTIPERVKVTLSETNKNIPTFHHERLVLTIPSQTGIHFHVFVGEGENKKEIFLPGFTPDSSPAFDYAVAGTYSVNEGLRYGEKITVVPESYAPNVYDVQAPEKFEFFPRNRSQGDLTFGDEFNSSALNENWTVKSSNWDGISNAYTPFTQISNSWYTGSAQEISHDAEGADGGVLKLTTRRHCLDETKQEQPNDANAQEAPCPQGLRTVYTSTTISSPYLYQAPVVVETRVRPSAERHLGGLFSLFLHNDQGFCSQNNQKADIAEFDVMELYTSPTRTYDDRSTHISCDLERNPLYNTTAHNVKKDLAGQWHTLKFTFDGENVRYFIDNQPMSIRVANRNSAHVGKYAATHETYGMTKEEFHKATNEHPYRITISADMYGKNITWNPPMPETEVFKTRVDLVDWVRVRPMTDIEISNSKAEAKLEYGITQETTKTDSKDLTAPAPPIETSESVAPVSPSPETTTPPSPAVTVPPTTSDSSSEITSAENNTSENTKAANAKDPTINNVPLNCRTTLSNLTFGQTKWNVQKIGSGWSSPGISKVFNLGNFDGTGCSDTALIDSKGTLWLYPSNTDSTFGSRRKIGTGWQGMTRVFGGFDFDGDNLYDIISTDAAGTLYLYRGNGKGGFLQRKVIGSGWKNVSHMSISQYGYNQKPVISGVVTDRLTIWPTNGKGTFLTPVRYGLGWSSMKQIQITSDVSGDGVSDLWAITKSGELVLYKATNPKGTGFSSQKLGTGWGNIKYFIPQDSSGRVIRVIFPDGLLRQYTLLQFQP